MLSNVSLTGALGDRIDKNTRFVEVRRMAPDKTGKFPNDLIPVRSNLPMEAGFLKAPSGTFVCLLGHLEIDENDHLVVAVELEEVFQRNPS